MRLALGTVQFGLDYGVTNKTGKVPEQEVIRILSDLKKCSIDLLDTAQGYGSSEQLLGYHKKLLNSTKIVTKIKPEDLQISELYTLSLKRLQAQTMYGLMLHDADILLSEYGKRIWDQMLGFKHEKRVKKIGVSVYSPEQLSYILDHYDIDLVQLPINVFDQRFIQSGLLKKVKERRVEVHVRSIFLQGLTLQKSLVHYPALGNFEHLFSRYVKASLDAYHSLLVATLSFIKSIKEIDYVVVGVSSYNQFAEIVAAWQKVDTTLQHLDFSQFASNDLDFILPTRWG